MNKFMILILFFTFSVKSAKNMNFDDLSIFQQEQFKQIKKLLDELEDDYSDLEEAKIKIESFIDNEKNFLPIYFEQVRQIHKSGYYGINDIKAHDKEAIEILDEMLLKDPSYSLTYYYLGVLNMDNMKYDESEKMFLKSEKLDPLKPWLYNSFARLKLRQENYEDSLKLYKKAFILSKTDIYALINSIISVFNLSGKLNIESESMGIVDFIFNNFKEEKERLKIAQKIIGSSKGRPLDFLYAMKIIQRQKLESKTCDACNVELAYLNLNSGYKKTKNGVRLYYQESVQKAKEILKSYKGDKSYLNLRVFEMLFDIAFNDKDYTQVNKLMLDAKSKNIPVEMLELKKALLLFVNKQYKSVIEIFDDLILENKTLLDNKVYLKAKGRYGVLNNRGYKDYKGLKNHYLRRIDRYPDSAYVYGNYVSFLIRYEKNSSAEALKYGEKGLKIMQYGILKKNMGLIYHIEASKLDFSDRARKVNLFKKSLSMGDKDYSKDIHCTRCTSYSAVQSYIKEKKVKQKSFLEKYSTYFKLGMISFLFLLVVVRFNGKKKELKSENA